MYSKFIDKYYFISYFKLLIIIGIHIVLSYYRQYENVWSIVINKQKINNIYFSFQIHGSFLNYKYVYDIEY